ncbi:MAG: winged helix-turn-helix domain-containing protein [Coriobacteriales bacterium]
MLAEERDRRGTALPLSSLLVLDALKRNRRCTADELAGEVDIPSGRLKGTLERLAEAGLVEAKWCRIFGQLDLIPTEHPAQCACRHRKWGQKTGLPPLMAYARRSLPPHLAFPAPGPHAKRSLAKWTSS